MKVRIALRGGATYRRGEIQDQTRIEFFYYNTQGVYTKYRGSVVAQLKAMTFEAGT